MADREHEEWLRDEKERKQLSATHRAAVKKKHSSSKKQKSDAEAATAQERADRTAHSAADAQAAREREGGWQTGNAV
jgi:hypothetical protein